MIYGLEDTILLTRIAARKSIELAALAHDGGTVASMTSMMLVDDLNRIQLLLDLASNDLSDIERRLDLLTDVNDDLPDDIVQSYRSGLDDRSRSDEESFQALMVRAIILLGPLREGIALSRTISQGESPLGFSRANNIMKVRGIYRCICCMHSQTCHRIVENQYIQIRSPMSILRKSGKLKLRRESEVERQEGVELPQFAILTRYSSLQHPLGSVQPAL